VQAALKKLIKEIPTDWAGVSKFTINWSAFDEGISSTGPKIRNWVKKKTGELLGEEEISMVEFVMVHLKEHGSAKKLLASMDPVLDKEAEPFVTRLYRMLIFETQKYALGLVE
jgi:RNA-binding protein 25